MNKCHNCKMGLVDGGSAKRIKKEFVKLENEYIFKIGSITEKDKNKRKDMIESIKNKYDPLIKKKSQETPGRISKCCACDGSGFRK